MSDCQSYSFSESLEAQIYDIYCFVTSLHLHILTIEAFRKMHAVSSSSCISTCGKLNDPGNITNKLHRFAVTDVTSNQFVAVHHSLLEGVNDQIGVISV